MILREKDTKGNFFVKFAASIPGISMGVDDKIDPYTGETPTHFAGTNSKAISSFLSLINLISPMKLYWDADQDVKKESKKVGAETRGPSSTITIDGESVKLVGKELEDYLTLRARLVNEYSRELIVTDKYKKLDMDGKKSALKQVQSRATDEARSQIITKR